ncbi:MAG: LuxR C-terminal-related transcriptional regulator [Acidobacteriota bacterium]
MITPYRPSPEQVGVHLTSREKQIGELLARGFSNKAIAAELLLAESTAKIYVSRLYEKLGLSEADRA